MRNLMSNLSVAQQKHLTPTGGTYIAVNYLGWAMGITPWEAMARIDLNSSAIRPKVGTKRYKEDTALVSVYFLPDAEKMDGINRHYGPVDANDDPIGSCIYEPTQSW